MLNIATCSGRSVNNSVFNFDRWRVWKPTDNDIVVGYTIVSDAIARTLDNVGPKPMNNNLPALLYVDSGGGLLLHAPCRLWGAQYRFVFEGQQLPSVFNWRHIRTLIVRSVVCKSFMTIAALIQSTSIATPYPLFWVKFSEMPSCLCTRIIFHASGGTWGGLGRDLLIKDDDLCTIGDSKYLYITPHASSIVKFVAQGAPGMPDKLPKNMTLTSCLGLQQIIHARNEVAWPTPVSAGEALLFADVVPAPAKKPKRQRRTRCRIL